MTRLTHYEGQVGRLLEELMHRHVRKQLRLAVRKKVSLRLSDPEDHGHLARSLTELIADPPFKGGKAPAAFTLVQESVHYWFTALLRHPVWLSQAVAREVVLEVAGKAMLLDAQFRLPPTRPDAARPAPQPATLVQRRARKAVAKLGQWKRKQALAKTKVAAYRKKVAYYKKKGAIS
jgi:hypothetical protein